jgi:hypothetical protein
MGILPMLATSIAGNSDLPQFKRIQHGQDAHVTIGIS